MHKDIIFQIHDGEPHRLAKKEDDRKQRNGCWSGIVMYKIFANLGFSCLFPKTTSKSKKQSDSGYNAEKALLNTV